jgi:hypothetical protein
MTETPRRAADDDKGDEDEGEASSSSAEQAKTREREMEDTGDEIRSWAVWTLGRFFRREVTVDPGSALFAAAPSDSSAIQHTREIS